MSRRDAFSSLRQNEPGADSEQSSEDRPDAPPMVPIIPKQPLDLIPVAAPRKKRNRDWDRAHQVEKITYRGIPRSFQDTVNGLAASFGVPRDELVRALLEHSLSDYQANRLDVLAYPKAQRMTLFPTGKSAPGHWVKTNPFAPPGEWLAEAFPNLGQGPSPVNRKRRGKDTGKKERWESRATYRLPVDLKNQIKSIAEDHDVPVGEVALYFMDHGLRAYQSGELRLQPYPKSSGKTLFQD